MYSEYSAWHWMVITEWFNDKAVIMVFMVLCDYMVAGSLTSWFENNCVNKHEAFFLKCNMWLLSKYIPLGQVLSVR